VENMIENAEMLVAAMRVAVPDAILGVMLPTPPSTSQDSFGETNGNQQTRWGYRKNLLLAQTRLAQVFGGRQDENIHLVSAFTNLDCGTHRQRAQRNQSAAQQ